MEEKVKLLLGDLTSSEEGRRAAKTERDEYTSKIANNTIKAKELELKAP